MRRPSMFARLAARPVITLALLLLYAAIVYGWHQGFTVSFSWYQGAIPWWVAVAAVAAVFRTLAAALRVRRYKAWEAQWDAIGAEDEAPRKKRRGRVGAFVFIGAALVVVGTAAYWPLVQNNANRFAVPVIWIVVLWWLAGLYVVVYLVFVLGFVPMRAVHRHLRKRATAKAETAEAAPVTWLVGRASSSPSRADAVRNLPEYSARLINGNR